MREEELEAELEAVIAERKSWHGARGPFSEREVTRRELVLWKQALLYKIQDARENGDRQAEDFNTALLDLLNSELGLLNTTQDEVGNGQTLCSIHNFRKKYYKQTETAKRMFIRLYELAKSMGDEETMRFCQEILETFERHRVNDHIEWKR